MTVTIDAESGFCFGVTSAIRKAEEELQNGQLFCLGDIVHNGQEVERLERLGLETIDYERLRELRGGRVLLRAHGEPPSTYDIARRNGVEVIDASCPVVKKLQDRIRACYEQHKNDEAQPPQIVIYGKPGHAEVIGLQGQTNNTAVVIESPDQLDRLDFTRPIYLFSQTTMSVEAFRRIAEAIRGRVHGLLEYHDTICRNVANRVEKLQAFARAQDLVVFVGGEKSSNAKVLFGHCRNANSGTIFVSSPEEITCKRLQQAAGSVPPETMKIGICGATSTPLWLMEECKKRIEQVWNTKSRQ